MAMEEIDLSDRRGLIAMAYGSPPTEPEAAKSATASTSTIATTSNDKTPLNKIQMPEKQASVESAPPHKKDSRISCAKGTCCILVLCAIVACLLSALITYGLTKQAFDHPQSLPFVPDPRFNLSKGDDDVIYEEEDIDPNIPRGEALRLPKAISPLWYNATLQIYLPGFVDIDKDKNLTYDASVTMKLRFNDATDKIVLNSKNIALSQNVGSYRIMVDRENNNRVTRETNETAEGNSTESTTMPPTTTTTVLLPNAPVDSGIKITKIELNETVEMVTFYLSETVPAGKELYFKLAFSKPFGESLNGLYLSSYKTANGTERLLAATQMEPTYGRGFIPCFDEPKFKAVWKIKIIHPKGSIALSNGIEENDSVPVKDEPNWVWTSFSETPPMSSYLVAIVLSDFKYIEGNSKRGTRFRIWGRPEAVNQTSYALEIGTKALDFYEDYYEIPFPMPKQDMVALPDFDAGAMENIGLITYREIRLFYDPATYTLTDKQDLARTVTHELAHQWFGDMVTLSWWDETWLNEGFASFMEAKTIDNITNSVFRESQNFELDEHNSAFVRDSKSSSHPLSFNVSMFKEIKEAFDAVTYSKGASFLLMLEGILGKETFRKALSSYLKENMYKNTVADDLFAALNKVVPDDLLGWDGKKFDILDFAPKWTRQMGYPVIEMYRIDNQTLELTQKRFKENSLTPEKAKYRNARFWYKWDIPIWYSVDGNEKPLIWLHEAYRLNLTADEFLILNSQSLGFYRVNYDQRGWSAIEKQLHDDHTKIPVNARYRILDDAFKLADANQLPYEIAFNVSSYIAKETEPLPVIAVLNSYLDILGKFGDEADSEGIRKYIIPRVQELYDKVDFNNIDFSKDEDFLKSSAAALIIGVHCGLGSQDCGKKMREYYQTGVADACQDGDILSKCSKVPVHIRSIVYCQALKHDMGDAFDRFRNFSQVETEAIEYRRILVTFGCTREPYKLKKLLFDAINGTAFRDQDIATIFSGASSSAVGRYITGNFVMDNWRKIYDRFNEMQFVLKNIVAYGVRTKNDREIREVEYCTTKYPRSTKQTSAWAEKAESGRTTKNWNKLHRSKLVQYFNDRALQAAEKTEL